VSWDTTWDKVGRRRYIQPVLKGSVERLPSGRFRTVVRAGKDPITGRYVRLATTAGRLGHSDGGATTLRVYASWTQPADQRAAELLAGDLNSLRRKAAGAHMQTPRRLARAARPLKEVLPAVTAASMYFDVIAVPGSLLGPCRCPCARGPVRQ
jgi:hypothetical protein